MLSIMRDLCGVPYWDPDSNCMGPPWLSSNSSPKSVPAEETWLMLAVGSAAPAHQ